jgi:hypothetical protein
LLHLCKRYNVQTTEPEIPSETAQLVQAIQEAGGNLAVLLALWRDREPTVWAASVNVYLVEWPW